MSQLFNPPFSATHGQAAFYVPLASNAGEVFAPDVFARIEDRLLALAGGFTDAGTVRGAWRGPEGRVYRDTNREYRVAFSVGSDAFIAQLRALVADTARELDQEAMFLAVGDRVEFVSRAA
jgi:hypothetical protein